MRIKLLTSIAGTNFSHGAGSVVEWPDDAEAKRYIAAGLAEPVVGKVAKASDVAEVAVVRKATETADARRLTGKAGAPPRK